MREEHSLCRVRVGNYRIVYEVRDEVLVEVIVAVDTAHTTSCAKPPTGRDTCRG